MKVINVIGARPNFMKMAPIHNLMIKQSNIEAVLVNTGQHYDDNMSGVFFDELGLPEPDYYLGVGSDTHACQTAKIMVEFEKILLKEKYDLVMVAGDVNSTIACALVAVKLSIKVAHIESGLRSFDRTMPEEINRILTDSISDYLFVTENSGIKNLEAEGVPNNKIFFVGNTMIDSIYQFKNKANKSKILDKLKIKENNFILVTLHRPSNVDDGETLNQIINALNILQEKINIVFPLHPRTRKMLEKLSYDNNNIDIGKIHFCDPLGYLDFLKLMMSSKIVLTDSGGIQEETTALGIPCLTLRENTERPITLEIGTNKLVELSTNKIVDAVINIIINPYNTGKIPPLWDGQASNRIIKIIGHMIDGNKK